MSADIAVRVGIDTSSGQASVTTLGNVSEREFKRMQRSLADVNAMLRLQAQGQRAANEEAARIQQASKHMEQFGFNTARSKTELIVLAHELSQGRYSKFGGSMMVLAEATGAATVAFSAAGLAIGAATAVMGAFATAAVQGAIESDKLAKSMQLTGNFSGMTADAFQKDAERIGMATMKSAGAVKAVEMALVASGQFGPASIGKATEAVLRLEKVSGQSAEDIVKEFEHMGAGVAKFAEEQSKSLHFATAAQLEHIRTLEESGQREQAMGEVLDRLNVHLNTSASFWDKLRKAVGDTWDEMSGAGRTTTVGDQLDAVNKRLSEMDRIARTRRGLPIFNTAPDGKGGESRASAEAERHMLLMGQLRQAENATAAAEAARVQQAGIAANKFVRGIQDQIKSVDTLKKKVDEAKRSFADAAAAGTPVSAKDQAAILAELKKKHGGPAAPELGAIRDAQEQYKHWFMVREIEDYDTLAKAAADFAQAEQQRTAAVNIHLAENAAQADKFVAAMLEESQAVQMDATARKVLNEQLRIEVEAKKLIASLGTGANPADVQRIQAQAAAEAARAKQIGEDAKRLMDSAEFGAARGVDKFATEAMNSAANTERFVTGAFDNMASALEKFATTGKLNLGSLWTYAADEYIRQLSRMAVASMLPGGAGLNGLMGLFGSAMTVDTAGIGITGAGASLASLGLAGGRAAGGNVNAGSSYLVGERQPEVFTPGASGFITPISEMGGGGGTPAPINIGAGQIINIGQGVSRAEVYAAVNQSNKAAVAQIRRLQSTGRLA